MRELYACQLDFDAQNSLEPVWTLTSEWIERGAGLEPGALAQISDRPVAGNTQLELESINGAHGSGWLCSWRKNDDVDRTLLWRTLIAVGTDPASDGVRFSIRIGLERASTGFSLAPPRYTFGAPAIVRTLLREHEMHDGGAAVEPRYRVRRAGEIGHLVRLLEASERKLPVVVLSPTLPAQPFGVDAGELARELAGLAHVEVITTQLAATAFAEAVSRPLAVWGGAARVYWPGFHLADDPRRHRFWTYNELADRTNLVDRLRSWFGSLSAAAVPEHPLVVEARALRRERIRVADALPEWANEYVTEIEAALDDAREETQRLNGLLLESTARTQELESELAAVRQQFQVVHSQEAVSDDLDPVSLDDLSVDDAFHLAVSEAGAAVVFLPECTESIRNFTSYQSPKRLYEALSAVSEAASRWREGDLTTGFGQFFASRGYEYSQRNPAANARRTKSSYRRRYDGETVVMEPHLKVDQATSPDQCLRIYWYVDDKVKRLVIGHVGRHLPD